MAELPEIKKVLPEYKELYAQCLVYVLGNLEKSFNAFFRGKGFPKFRNRKSFNYICFPQYPHGCKIVNGELVISKVGNMPIKYSREISGNPKTVTITRSGTGKWHACFACDGVEMKILPKTGKQCGIDMGLKSFLVTSDNTVIDNPKFFHRSMELLKARQQRLEKAKRGTKKKDKLRLLVAKAHEKAAEQRRDFHFKTALWLVQNYDVIVHEDLDIRQMIKERNIRPLNRLMYDTAWGEFLRILEFKAEEAGKTIIKVKPGGTSDTCSKCGNVQEMKIHKRVYKCTKCGQETGRDLNSAINILRLAAGHSCKKAG